MDFSKTRVAILGVGAVGGYLGGKLAAHYLDSSDVEIIFIARGANRDAIRQNGLTIGTDNGEIVARPAFVSDDPQEIGFLDFVICCTKSFDLESSIESIRPCLTHDTVVIPLLNGVDAAERLSKVVLQGEVWNGCVYIVSRLISPGVVKQTGALSRFHFGSPTANQVKISEFVSILTDAGINAVVSDNITRAVWEKFIFLSPLATITSCYDMNIPEILASSTQSEQLRALMHEIETIAHSAAIPLAPDIVNSTFEKMKLLPKGTTSSMHSDFQNRRKNELQSLTGIVVNLGRKYGVGTPVYQMMLNSLESTVENWRQWSDVK